MTTPRLEAPTDPRPVVDLAAARIAAGSVLDPEIRRTLAEMDLLDEVVADQAGDVTVHYHLTSPLCPSPFAIQIGVEVRRRVQALPGVRSCRVLIADHFIADEISRQVNDQPLHVPMTADEAAAIRAAGALAGRREAALLGDPSVVRTAALLAARCPSPAWVRAAVTTLDRFAQTIPDGDLSRLLDRLRSRPSDADACLYQYANALNGYADTQIAWLAFGPKLWLATNGVGLAWRPLPARTTSLTRTVATGSRRGHIEDAPARLLLLLLVGSGLTAEEAVRLRLGDLGHVDEDCALVPDLFAEPLGVRYSPTEPAQFPETGVALTFLGFEAREALHADLVHRAAAGEPTNAETPILGLVDVEAVMERARSRHSALIEAGNDVNVASCRATGDFFRQWGLPGAAFDAARSRPSVN